MKDLQQDIPVPRERLLPPGREAVMQAEVWARIQADGDHASEPRSPTGMLSRARSFTRVAGAGRRKALVGSLAAALAVSIFVGVFASTGGGVQLEDEALAALGKGPVLHYIEELPSNTGLQVVNLRTGAPLETSREREVWYDTERGLVHIVMRENGAIVGEQLGSAESWTVLGAGRVLPSASRPEPPTVIGGFLDQYRAALSDGSAEFVRDGQFEGRRVSYLHFRSVPDQSQPADSLHSTSYEVAIDRETFEPLVVRAFAGSRLLGETRLRLVEAMPSGAGDFSAPTLQRAAIRARVVSSSEISMGQAAALLGGQLVPRESIAGLPLRVIRQQEIATVFTGTTSKPVVLTGVQSLYGAVDDPESIGSGLFASGGRYVVISESLEPQLFYGWSKAEASRLSSGKVGHYRSGVGLFFYTNGVYVTVSSPDASLIMKAAREIAG